MLVVLVLAAGQGKRMRSETPKVLHPCGGVPMLVRVVRAVCPLHPAKVVVAGCHRELFRQTLETWGVEMGTIVLVDQPTPRGTGDAVRCCLPAFGPDDRVLVLNGDMPLIGPVLLEKLLSEAAGVDGMVLTTRLDNPQGYGRVVYGPDGGLAGIVEEKDCSPGQRQLCEVNTGVYVFRGGVLHDCLPRITNDNQQHEYYLTDVIRLAVADYRIGALLTEDHRSVRGANTPEELEELSAWC